MNFHRFHKRYYAHLQDRAEDVVRMAALDTNNEKWFQGEMVLAFCASGNGCRIFSSEYYNKKADNLDWAVWDECVSERGIVTIEADVYRAVKTSKYASSNVRKVDFLMENQGELILSELKLLWLCEAFEKDPYVYLEKKKVLEDAWRLNNHLASTLTKKDKPIYKYLSLICVADCGLEDHLDDAKEEIVEALNYYLEKKIINKKNIVVNKISYDTNNFVSICSLTDGNKVDPYNVYLMSIDLNG